MISGSDRFCDRWHQDYAIGGVEGLGLHHLYRAMAFLGDERIAQANASPFAPRCNKDLIEEDIFFIAVTFLRHWTWCFSIQLPFISKVRAAKLSGGEGIARITART